MPVIQDFSKSARMDYSVESIKKWLKSTGKDRNWLAEKLYVSKSTVDNWLAPSTPTPIPKSKAAFIHSLMEQSQTVESKKVNYDDVLTFSVRLTPEEWKALLPPHVDPKDYAAAEKYIRNLLQSIVDSTPPMPRPQEPDNNA
ncbi:MAG: hypothetical protein ACLSGE_13485 [Akkermansia sp.]|uniref:hypothetical protein n=2 Tax=Akkermansia sp. TaxID=1872421 RepID=UPI0027B8FFCC|nr:hypothetical protein [Akkermansia sp.]MBS7153435.1 hypothetical protein [Akkermansia sp.]